MAQTTTAENACGLVVYLDNAAGTPTDISGSTTKVDWKLETGIGQFSTFASRWPGSRECEKIVEVTLNAVYSTTSSEAAQLLLAWWFAASPSARTLKFYMPNKNVGSNYITGEFRLKSLSWTGDHTDPAPVAFTATLVPDGEVTHSISGT